MSKWLAIKSEILTASEHQLDGSMRIKMEGWPDDPTSLQILEVLDHSVHGSLASGFMIQMLQLLYDDALRTENKTHEENVPLATWRHE